MEGMQPADCDTVWVIESGQSQTQTSSWEKRFEVQEASSSQATNFSNSTQVTSRLEFQPSDAVCARPSIRKYTLSKDRSTKRHPEPTEMVAYEYQVLNYPQCDEPLCRDNDKRNSMQISRATENSQFHRELAKCIRDSSVPLRRRQNGTCELCQREHRTISNTYPGQSFSSNSVSSKLKLVADPVMTYGQSYQNISHYCFYPDVSMQTCGTHCEECQAKNSACGVAKLPQTCDDACYVSHNLTECQDIKYSPMHYVSKFISKRFRRIPNSQSLQAASNSERGAYTEYIPRESETAFKAPQTDQDDASVWENLLACSCKSKSLIHIDNMSLAVNPASSQKGDFITGTCGCCYQLEDHFPRTNSQDTEDLFSKTPGSEYLDPFCEQCLLHSHVCVNPFCKECEIIRNMVKKYGGGEFSKMRWKECPFRRPFESIPEKNIKHTNIKSGYQSRGRRQRSTAGSGRDESSSDGSGSDDEGGDGDGTDDDEFLEHGDAGSDNEDSGGGSDSESDEDESLNSAEIYDNQINAFDAKDKNGGSGSDGGGDPGSECTDSLTELGSGESEEETDSSDEDDDSSFSDMNDGDDFNSIDSLQSILIDEME